MLFVHFAARIQANRLYRSPAAAGGAPGLHTAVVGIATSSGLIVAALNLKLVRLLRQAIATNAICASLGPCDRLACRSRLRAELTPKIAPDRGRAGASL